METSIGLNCYQKRRATISISEMIALSGLEVKGGWGLKPLIQRKGFKKSVTICQKNRKRRIDW
jgi:hypothetical protein